MQAQKTISTTLSIVLSIVAVTSELLHLVNDPYRGIFLALSIAIIWLAYYAYNTFGIQSYKTTIFYTRDRATPSMKKDIKNYKHLAFIGISQQSLNIYLSEVINEDKEKPLPWESITVYFANDIMGKLREEEYFEKNVRESKLKIAGLLFGESNYKRLKNFTTLDFRQIRLSTNFAGCFCGNVVFDQEAPAPEIIYSVNSLPNDLQTQNSWTVRVEKKSKSNNPHLFNVLEASFIKIKDNSDELGKQTLSAWEWSSSAWNNFENFYSGFKTGVDEMVAQLDLNDRKVLDIGAGTGNVSKYLLSLYPKAKFTLIDNSANMLLSAKTTIGDAADYELFSIPIMTDHFINKHKDHFDYVISHLSIQTMAHNLESLHDVASNCMILLKKGGVVLMAVHHSRDISLSHANDVKIHDIFVHDIEKELSKGNLVIKNRNKAVLNDEDIANKFEALGFYQSFRKDINMGFSFYDKKRLW